MQYRVYTVKNGVAIWEPLLSNVFITVDDFTEIFSQGRVPILLDKVLKHPYERSRRCFCIAHEVFHYIESILTESPVVSAYHREFDSSREYPIGELSEMLSFRECQADRGAAALLMPAALVRNTCLQFTGGQSISVFGENVFTSKDKEILQDMAEYLGVSYTALTIRMKQLKLLEKHKLDEYISTELHQLFGRRRHILVAPPCQIQARHTLSSNQSKLTSGVPVQKFKRLARPCAFGVGQAFDEVDSVVGGSFVVVGIVCHEFCWCVFF